MRSKTLRNKVLAELTKLAKDIGLTEADYPTPTETGIVWESGPYEWAIAFSGYWDILSSELGGLNGSPRPQDKKLLDLAEANGLIIEAVTSFEIDIY